MEKTHGRIERLLPVHGVVVTDDGGHFAFHRNSVVDARFDRLQVGDAVDLLIDDSVPPQRVVAVIPGETRTELAT